METWKPGKRFPRFQVSRVPGFLGFQISRFPRFPGFSSDLRSNPDPSVQGSTQNRKRSTLATSPGMRVWRSKPGEVLSATFFHLICGQQGVGPGSARHTRPRMHTILKWGVLHCAPFGATCTLILRTPFACDSPLWRRISVRSRNLSLRTAVPAQNENVCCNFGACIAKLKVFCVSMRRMCSPYPTSVSRAQP